MRVKSFSIVIVLILSIILPGCRGCSRSGRESLRGEGAYDYEDISTPDPSPLPSSGGISPAETAKRVEPMHQPAAESNIVKMRHERGTYYIPLIVNGVEMEFVFDTGASIISISAAEAIFMLRHGKLSDDDILGTSYFSDATGTISEGTIINLREVKIGTRTLNNVKASVVHNLEAPLLLGQSALNQFGRIIIDYNQNILILE